MEQEQQLSTRWEGYVDWRNRAAIRGRHGGMLAASFVLVAEILENLAYLANASNLVLYLSKYMHLSPSKAANNVTDFMGTAFLLALLGGFLSDAFFTAYHIYLISTVTELLAFSLLEHRYMIRSYYYHPIVHQLHAICWLKFCHGLIILTVQARLPSLKPPTCSPDSLNNPCQEVEGGKAALLFIGLYLVALGVGGIKGSLPSHGAEQFDESTPQGRKQRSTFFNFYVFCLACGGLIAVTLVVWIEDNKGWEWGFGIATISILLSIPVFLAGSTLYRNKIPCGSPLTTIFKVLIAATLHSCMTKSPSNAIASMAPTPSSPTPTSKAIQEGDATEKEASTADDQDQAPTQSLKFLNRAVQVDNPAHKALECTLQQVEEVKIVLKILPIFACTVMLNCCLAQLSTFSVQQAATMDTKLGSLKVPPASLPIFPVLFIMILAPVYDFFIIPFARKSTKSEMGITHLQRIGIGLALSIIAMAIAALVEIKRKRVASNSGLLDSKEPLPITFFWVALQYLFLGSADLFTLAGLLEFFFTEAPTSMRSLATSLTWASLAMGYYLSSVIVSVVNDVSGKYSKHKWLSGSNLNHYHLERFYWLMCVLSGLNFLHYLFWATRYKYRPGRPNK